MDVWRYSDWYGRRSVPDVMNSYPMVWRWRDWIVRSINEDKPYDQMVVEMLAADELLPADDQNIVATGYLVRSWFKWNYETWKKDLVEHTGKAFLGLTLNCCQCHDHKYDPFTQEEYFRFRAFFEPLELRHDRVPGEADPGPFAKYVYAQSYGPISSGMVRVFDEYLDAETFMFSKGDSRLRIEGKPPMSPGAPAVLGGDQLQIAHRSCCRSRRVSGDEGIRAGRRTQQTARLRSPRHEAELAEARQLLCQPNRQHCGMNCRLPKPHSGGSRRSIPLTRAKQCQTRDRSGAGRDAVTGPGRKDRPSGVVTYCSGTGFTGG